MKIHLFCKCGAGAEGEIEGLDGAAEKFQHWWAQIHNGPRCAPCEKPEAAAAFNKETGSKP